MSEELESKKGKAITCRYCSHEFRFTYKSDRRIWTDNLLPCPKCNISYCTLPATERELHILQTIYLKTRLEKDLTAIVKILIPYVGSLIKKHFSNKIREKGKLEYYTHTAVTLLIEKYLVKPEFKIITSFANYLKHKIKFSHSFIIISL